MTYPIRSAFNRYRDAIQRTDISDDDINAASSAWSEAIQAETTMPTTDIGRLLERADVLIEFFGVVDDELSGVEADLAAALIRDLSAMKDQLL